MEIDLRQLLKIARRWWWLAVVVTLLAGTTAFVASSRQTPMYSASVTLLVNPGQSTTATDFSTLQASRGQAETYRMLIETGPVLDRVVETLDLPYGAPALGAKISSATIRDTQLVKITVTDPSADQAALIANTLAGEFKDYVQERSRASLETNLSGLNQQIVELHGQRQEIDKKIAQLDTEENAGKAPIQRQLNGLSDERSRINQTLSDVEAAALTIKTEMATNNPQVDIADPARAPSAPYAPRVLFTTLLGAFVGMLLSVGFVALLEFLDNTVKPGHDVAALIEAPVLASIAELPRLPAGAGQVYTIARPRANATEAIRLLRTNLDFAAATQAISALTVTSAGPGEGKSTVTANLGVVMAQAGFETVIIDADLRKPTQHKIFGVQNASGLTSLLTHPERSWRDSATRVALPGLSLVPSGPLPPNPADLLSSDRFRDLVERIKQDADIVIIDTAPVLPVSDALAIAPRTDGLVLVTRPNHTKVEMLRHAAHSIHQGDIRLIGVVMNRLRKQHGEVYYYEEYYGTDEATAPGAVPAAKRIRKPFERLKRSPGSAWQGM